MAKMALESRRSNSLKSLLEQHSRSFALTLFALPRQKREAVCLAYLIARLADTIADSSASPTVLRRGALAAWKSSVFSENLKDWKAAPQLSFSNQKEDELIQAGTRILDEYFRLSRDEKFICQSLFTELFEAMEWMLLHAPSEKSKGPKFLIRNLEEFDQYCYQHAGCVGKFWVEIFGLKPELKTLAIHYGKALERVNILRDVVNDFEQGIVLLPQSELSRFGFHSVEPWKEVAWSSFVTDYIESTQDYLRDAAQFCDSIAWGNLRLRWASMMPLKIAVASLRLFQNESEKRGTSKITRSEVKGLAFESLLDAGFNRKIALRLFE